MPSRTEVLNFDMVGSNQMVPLELDSIIQSARENPSDPFVGSLEDRIKQIVDASFPSTVKFAACANTKDGMEKREGKAISVVSQAEIVPSGAVRLIELQEQGWSYLRP